LNAQKSSQIKNLKRTQMKQFLIVFCLFPFMLISQVPQLINYQGILRNTLDLPITDQNISLRVSILEEGPEGIIIYSENHTVYANRYGLVNLQFGSGEAGEGEFSSIDWSRGNYWLQIEADPEGGDNYIFMGANPLVSVPYALHAETVTFNDDADADPENELINDVSLQGNVLTILENENEFSIDLGVFSQTLTKNGNVITLSNNGGSVIDEIDDADADPTNELQNLTLAGKNLSISSGNTVNLSGITPWQTYSNGIYYNQGKVWVGSNGQAPGVLFNHESVNVFGDKNSSFLEEAALYFDDGQYNRTHLGQSILEFWDGNGNYSAAIGGYPGFIGTYLDGNPICGIGTNSSKAGQLGLYNPSGNLNINIGSPLGNPEAGIMDLSYANTVKIRLEATYDDAGHITTFNSNDQPNTIMGYISNKPNQGVFSTYNEGSLRSILSSSSEDAGYILLKGPSYPIFGAGNLPTYPNSGFVYVLHDGYELIRLTKNDAFDFGGQPNSSGMIRINDPYGKKNILLSSLDNGSKNGKISIFDEEKVKIDLFAGGTDSGVIQVKGASGENIIDLANNLSNKNGGEIRVLNDGYERVSISLDKDRDAGLIEISNNYLQKVEIRENEKKAGEIKLFDPGNKPFIALGSSFIDDYGPQVSLFKDDSEVLRLGSNLASNGGYIEVNFDDKTKFDLVAYPEGYGVFSGYGESNDLIFEMRPPQGEPNTGGMGFYGPGQLENITFGMSDNANTGTIATYTYGNPITLLGANPGEAGTISTFHKDGTIATQASTTIANGAGSYTTYLDGNPQVEILSSNSNAGYIKAHGSSHPLIHMTNNDINSGSIWLANTNNQWDAILGSNVNSSGGLLNLFNAGNPRVSIYSGHGIPGVIETYTPDGQICALMGYQYNQPYSGGFGTWANGSLRTNIACNHETTAGSIGTYGENGTTNCLIGNLVNADNSGFISVHDWGGGTRAGMYVNSDGQGILFGNLQNVTMEDPEDDRNEICYANIAGPEAAAYLRGTSKLDHGRGNIEFPTHFQHMVNASSMTVMLTPLSAESKGLAVVQKNENGFIVVELSQGKGNYEFDWEVKCNRKGFENYRVRREKARAAEMMVIEPPSKAASAGEPGTSSEIYKNSSFQK